MRFLLDEDISDEVAHIARNLGLDAQSVHELGRRGFSDDEQFGYAIDQGMVMVTCNRNDFLALNNEHFENGIPNCGLLIVRHTLPGDQPARIAHRLREWHDEKVNAPDSFGPYVVDFL